MEADEANGEAHDISCLKAFVSMPERVEGGWLSLRSGIWTCIASEESGAVGLR